VQGSLTFDASNSISSGNSFADLLMGNISTFQQVNLAPKYYFRYQIVEPYFQDDWHVTPHLTLNLGMRVSLFGTYREKLNQTYNFQANGFVAGSAPFIDDGSVTGTEGALLASPTGPALSQTDPRNFNGIVQCGGKGIPSGCVNGHLFNPGPRMVLHGIRGGLERPQFVEATESSLNMAMATSKTWKRWKRRLLWC